jgi:non-ribosomal peptide synthetase component F
LERDVSRNPIFDVALVVQNMDLPEIRLREVTFSPYAHENRTSKFDLSLYVTEEESGVLHLSFEYSTWLFKRCTIERMREHFCRILEEVLSDPDIVLAEVGMLSGAEREQLLKTFNGVAEDSQDAAEGTHHADPDTAQADVLSADRLHEQQTIDALFAEQAGRTPDEAAVTDGKNTYTYRKLEEEANRLARYLLSEHKLEAESRIGIFMEACVEQIVSVLGTLKAGAAYVPIDPSWPQERVRTIVEDAGIGVLLSQEGYIQRLKRLQWECRGLETYVCLDCDDVYAVRETESNQLMDRELWEYVGENAKDEIAGGGWVNSYTGEDISAEEMEEYADNVYEKLKPHVHPEARVLEIGCASGLSMFKVAPHVGLYYGTDLSQVILDRNEARIREEGLGNIRQTCLAAHEIDQLEERDFDIVNYEQCGAIFP